MKTGALAAGMYLATALASPATAAPDPATECIKPNVTCIAPSGSLPTGNWHTDTLTALAANKEVYLTDGDLDTLDVYQIPLASSPSLSLDGPGKLIRGEGMYNTIFKGDGTGGNTGTQIAIVITSTNNGVYDMHIRDVRSGVTFLGDDWDGATLGRVHIDNTRFGGEPVFFNQSIKPGNSSYNILFDECLFNDTQLVTHFASQGGVTIEQKYPKYLNTSFIGITNPLNQGIVIDAPYVTATQTYLAESEGCTFSLSDNHLTEGFLDSLDGGGGNIASAGSFRPAIPSRNVEGPQVGIDPDSGQPAQYTLANPSSGIPIGEFNRDSSVELPLTPVYFRPILDLGTHPTVGNELGSKGHSGHVYAAGTFGSNAMTLSSYQNMRAAIRNQLDEDPISPEAMSYADFNGDGIANELDFGDWNTPGTFMFGTPNTEPFNMDWNQNGKSDLTDIIEGDLGIGWPEGPVNLDTNNNGVLDEAERISVPTVSQWGMTAMGLTLATAGTVILRRRKQHTVVE